MPANVTHRYVRGELGLRKPGEIYRASLRGQSIHMRERTESVARELAAGALQMEEAKAAMIRTRRKVRRDWQAVSDILVRQKREDLALQVRQFVAQIPPVMTDKEYIAARFLEQQRERRLTQGVPLTPSRFTPPHRSR